MDLDYRRRRRWNSLPNSTDHGRFLPLHVTGSIAVVNNKVYFGCVGTCVITHTWGGLSTNTCWITPTWQEQPLTDSAFKHTLCTAPGRVCPAPQTLLPKINPVRTRDTEAPREVPAAVKSQIPPLVWLPIPTHVRVLSRWSCSEFPLALLLAPVQLSPPRSSGTSGLCVYFYVLIKLPSVNKDTNSLCTAEMRNRSLKKFTQAQLSPASLPTLYISSFTSALADATTPTSSSTSLSTWLNRLSFPLFIK